MAETTSALTDEIRKLIGVTAEKVQANLWGIEREDLRRFTQAIMDPDPRYWDDEFAKKTKFGGIVTPPIYCTYLSRKTPPGAEDPITRAFQENPNSDGIGGVEENRRGSLPNVPTPLKRILNAGNEIELYRYPTLGDRIYSQAKYADIKERVTKDGTHMLIITTETTYTDQNGAVLCILRASSIRR
jgi:MaoC dehydratase-like protein